jgi:hypothetical protein
LYFLKALFLCAHTYLLGLCSPLAFLLKKLNPSLLTPKMAFKFGIGGIGGKEILSGFRRAISSR